MWRLLDKGTGRLVRADLLSSLVHNVPLGNVKEAIQQTTFDFTLPLLFTGSRALQVLATQEMNALEKRLSLVMFGSQLAFLYCDKVNLARIKH